MSFKNVTELSLAASEEHMGNAPRATVAFAVLPPLDPSFHCEGGSCSLRFWNRSRVPRRRETLGTVPKPNLSLREFLALGSPVESRRLSKCDVVSLLGRLIWLP